MKWPASATSSSSSLSALSGRVLGGERREHQVIACRTPACWARVRSERGVAARAASTRKLAQEEAAIEPLGRTAALAVEPADERIDVGRSHARVAKAASGEAAPEPATAQPARAEHGHVQEAPRVEHRAPGLAAATAGARSGRGSSRSGPDDREPAGSRRSRPSRARRRSRARARGRRAARARRASAGPSHTRARARRSSRTRAGPGRSRARVARAAGSRPATRTSAAASRAEARRAGRGPRWLHASAGRRR